MWDCVPPRLCVTLGALGVTLHRLTQIFTDLILETADFANSAEKICANLCNLWFFLGVLGVLPQILNR